MSAALTRPARPAADTMIGSCEYVPRRWPGGRRLGRTKAICDPSGDQTRFDILRAAWRLAGRELTDALAVNTGDEMALGPVWPDQLAAALASMLFTDITELRAGRAADACDTCLAGAEPVRDSSPWSRQALFCPSLAPAMA
jgi:hypothetical protein